jgi:hypothetical protein
MINAKDHYVAWAGLVTEIDEAREHLEALAEKLATQGECDEEDLAVNLGHIYAHLNRAWHSRNQNTEISETQWEEFSQFPKDVKPVG